MAAGFGVVFFAQVYGSYYRKLSKRVQSALAEANAVAEEVLSAMATVSIDVAITIVRLLLVL